MSEADVSTLLRALGNVEGKIDGVAEKVDSVDERQFRLDSKLNDAHAHVNARLESEREARNALHSALREHVESDGRLTVKVDSMEAKLRTLTRYALAVVAGEAILLAAFAPDYLPRVAAFLADKL